MFGSDLVIKVGELPLIRYAGGVPVVVCVRESLSHGTRMTWNHGEGEQFKLLDVQNI